MRQTVPKFAKGVTCFNSIMSHTLEWFFYKEIQSCDFAWGLRFQLRVCDLFEGLMHCILHKLLSAFLAWVLQRLDHFMSAMVTNLRPKDFEDFTCILLVNSYSWTPDCLQESGGLALVFPAFVENAQFLTPIELVNYWNKAHSFG